MRKLFFLIVIAGGAWQISQNGFPSLSSVKVYDESGNPIVKLITVDDCGKPCQMAKNELKRRRVDFEEITINPNDDSNNDDNLALWKKVGRNSFPLIASGEEVINGSGTPAAMATMLGLNYDDKYLTRTEQRLFKNHFNQDGSPKIVVYGTSWCPGTKKLREELKASNVDFVEIDVERNGDQERLLKTMEIGGYPATWVGYTRVNGTNLKSVNSVLKSY